MVDTTIEPFCVSKAFNAQRTLSTHACLSLSLSLFLHTPFFLSSSSSAGQILNAVRSVDGVLRPKSPSATSRTSVASEDSQSKVTSVKMTGAVAHSPVPPKTSTVRDRH